MEILSLIIFAVVITAILTLLFKNNKNLKSILAVALICKLIFFVINEDFINILDSDMSEIWIEKAFEMLSLTEFGKIAPYEKMYAYSFLVSKLFNIFIANKIIPIFCSILISIFSVILFYKTLNLFLDEKSSISGTWVYALFPSFINYSVLPLREIYIQFFILLQLHFFIRYLLDKKLSRFIWFAFIIIILFPHYYLHGGVILIIFPMFIYVFSVEMHKLLFDEFKENKNLKMFSLIILSMCFVFLLVDYYENFIFKIPYLSNIPYNSIKALDLNPIFQKFSFYQKGNLTFPSFLIPSSNLEFIILLPVRLIYFLFSPFFWQINNISHLFALLDSLIYFLLILVIIFNYNIIKKNKILFFCLITFIFLALVFLIGTGNSGTAIRHRAKFAVLILTVCAPFFNIYFYNCKSFLKKIRSYL